MYVVLCYRLFAVYCIGNILTYWRDYRRFYVICFVLPVNTCCHSSHDPYGGHVLWASFNLSLHFLFPCELLENTKILGYLVCSAICFLLLVVMFWQERQCNYHKYISCPSHPPLNYLSCTFHSSVCHVLIPTTLPDFACVLCKTVAFLFLFCWGYLLLAAVVSRSKVW